MQAAYEARNIKVVRSKWAFGSVWANTSRVRATNL